MPVWLQLTAALSAALAAGIMGIAYVPFLQKLRFCEPEESREQKEAAGEKLRPTLCGVLAVFGCTFGLVLGYTLYLQFGEADRTDRSFQEALFQLQCWYAYGILAALLGLAVDVMAVHRRIRYRVKPFWQAAVMFVAAYVMQLAGMQVLQTEETGLRALLAAGMLTLSWGVMQPTDREADGAGITASGILMACLAVIHLADDRVLPALLSLTAAGACMGCMVWDLPPAKCRLGTVGSSWLGAMLPVLCPDRRTLCLCMAVYLVNVLPLLRKKERKTLLASMDGSKPWKRLAVFAGYAGFCGVLAVWLAVQ